MAMLVLVVDITGGKRRSGKTTKGNRCSARSSTNAQLGVGSK